MAGSNSKFIDQIIKQIEHLPTLPQVVSKVLAMTESPDINAVKLSKALDQSLAAKVLKMANSAYYGRRKVNTIPHAVVIIGLDAVKEIILTTSFFHTFHDEQDVLALQPLWRHSLEVALVAKRLAWVYRYESLDEAYFAGLIHDIGKLVVQQYFPAQYLIIQKKKDEGVGELEAEREVLNITHADIGGKMSEHWAFPESLVDAVTHHHDEKWKLNPKLGKILFYSNCFVLGLYDFANLLVAFSQAGMFYPNTWDPSDLESVEEIVQEEIEKARAIFTSALDLT